MFTYQNPPSTNSFIQYTSIQIQIIERILENELNPSEQTINLKCLHPHLPTIKKASRLVLIGNGSGYFSSLASRRFLEKLSNIPVTVGLACDLSDRTPVINRQDVCIFIDHSEHTKDMLEFLKYCNTCGAFTVAFTNQQQNEIVSESTCSLKLNYENDLNNDMIGWFALQTLGLILLAFKLGEDRIELIYELKQIFSEIQKIPDRMHKIASSASEEVKNVAFKIMNHGHLLLLGRGENYPVCLEGAYVLKRIAGIFADGIAAGELKHGPLALVDEELPILVLIMEGDCLEKVTNSLQQVVARRAKPILVTDCPEQFRHFELSGMIDVPHTVECLQPLLSILPLLNLAYAIKSLRKHQKED